MDAESCMVLHWVFIILVEKNSDQSVVIISKDENKYETNRNMRLMEVKQEAAQLKRW